MKVVEEEIQEPEDVRDLPVLFFSPYSFTKDYSVLFSSFIFFNF
ncbi:hypothetical protein BN890_23360 [Bacteroides xylanisolvens SD CC 1b]|uniref:Uncharacterized protein n=1 Tax=Bacteroides xylanisolvens SD CC 1b TaxID=702447 RepID=W6PLA0_9BACE|nr:hypothetical protein BN890_23360 [Bacteroides xylanisolvens SD CC 1b]